MKQILVAALLLHLLFQSCSDIFEYSPFDANVKSEGLNNINIGEILNGEYDSDTLIFAVFSDTHENYDLMAKALSKIATMPEIKFIICNGDVTNKGLAQEYLWYIDVMKKSPVPLVTVIGNHDCLANGPLIYDRLFGPANTSFTVRGYKFIMFNNVIWENHNNSPAYLWLKEELSDTTLHNLVISHVPPMVRDIGDLHRIIYDQIVDSTNTIYAIHSSAHHFFEYYSNGIPHFISASIDKREFYVISLAGGNARLRRVNF